MKCSHRSTRPLRKWTPARTVSATGAEGTSALRASTSFPTPRSASTARACTRVSLEADSILSARADHRDLRPVEQVGDHPAHVGPRSLTSRDRPLSLPDPYPQH